MENAKKLVEEIQNETTSLWKSEQDSAVGINKVGRALNKLKHEKLYKQVSNKEDKKYSKWMVFIKEEFGFTPQYANRLMVDAKVQQKLEDNGLTTVKQPDAILYMIRNAEDLASLWAKVTNGNTTMIPTRSQVQEAMEKPSRGKKAHKQTSVQGLLSAIREFLTSNGNEKEELLTELKTLLKTEGKEAENA